MESAPPLQSLDELLEASVERFGRRTLFLRRSGEHWARTSYAEFGKIVADLRAGLAALGITRGDRVAVISGNSVEWAAIAYASFGLGAALVPMYESQRESDWNYIVRDSGAKLLFASTPEIFAKVSGFSASAPKLKHVSCIAGSYAAILQEGRRQPAQAGRHARREDTAALLYTSGTTGEPKGVVLSHGNVLANVLSLKAIIQSTIDKPEEHRALSFLPWAHAFGHTVELHTLVACGATLALAESLDKVADNIKEVKPTVLVAVPTVFVRIHAGVEKLMDGRSRFVSWLFRRGLAEAAVKRRGAGSLRGKLLLLAAEALIFSRVRARFGGRLRFAICGAAALPREAGEFMDALGIAVYEGYGLTEASPIVSANTPEARRLGSAGKPLPGVRVVIEQAQDSAEASGEIVVYGDNVMQGYHGQDSETRRALTAARGLRTGDLGYLDADGFLWITGRIKEQYKLSNGKYVAPSALEERLKLSPFIENVMVYGDNRAYNVALVVPDLHTLRAFADAQGLAAPDPTALLEHPRVRSQFSRELERFSTDFKGYERVRRFAFAPEPFSQASGMLTPSLKLKRHEILRRWGHLLQELYPDSAEPRAFDAGAAQLTS